MTDTFNRGSVDPLAVLRLFNPEIDENSLRYACKRAFLSCTECKAAVVHYLEEDVNTIAAAIAHYIINASGRTIRDPIYILEFRRAHPIWGREIEIDEFAGRVSEDLGVLYLDIDIAKYEGRERIDKMEEAIVGVLFWYRACAVHDKFFSYTYIVKFLELIANALGDEKITLHKFDRRIVEAVFTSLTALSDPWVFDETALEAGLRIAEKMRKRLE